MSIDEIVLVGLGATGSVVAALLARMSGISRIVLIDHEVYSTSNISGQVIDHAEVGLPKVEVQAARIAAINPSVRVACLQERVENVPMALLRDVVILCCVDNRRARHTINRLAWRMGSPWLDVAVSAPSLLRVNGYQPGGENPCLECGLDQRGYDLLEQEYPCEGGEAAVPSTRTPAELSGLAASLLVVELRKLLHQSAVRERLIGAQLMLDTGTYEQHRTHFLYNPQCRFDHQAWCLQALDTDIEENTLADLFASLGAASDSSIGLEGQVFVTHLDCVGCGGREDVGLCVYGRLQSGQRTCGCGGRLLATGFTCREVIRQPDLCRQHLALCLNQLGLRNGDVISVGSASGSVHHLELKGVNQHG